MVNLSLWRPLLFVLSLDSHVHSGTALVTVRQAPTFPTTSGTGTALGNFPPHHFRYTYGARHGAAGAYVPTTRVYVRRGHFQHGAVTVRRAPTFLRRTYFRRSHFRHGAVTAVRRAPTFLRVLFTQNIARAMQEASAERPAFHFNDLCNDAVSHFRG